MKKTEKVKKRKPRLKDKTIDGLPVLRGMFVCPESLSDILLPPFADLVSFDSETNEQQKPLMEG
jgi:hypothetical protein